MELEALQAVHDQIEALGASLVALSPSTVEKAAAAAKKGKLSFDILSDAGNGYADKLGLTFTLPDDLRKVYLALGIDLPKHNGDDSWVLPLPGRFVVDTGGIVRYSDAAADYTVRPEPQATLNALRSLAS